MRSNHYSIHRMKRFRSPCTISRWPVLQQIARNTDLAAELIKKSIKILDHISEAIKIQNLSVLKQAEKRFEIDEALKDIHLDGLSNPVLLQEFDTVGLSSVQNGPK